MKIRVDKVTVRSSKGSPSTWKPIKGAHFPLYNHPPSFVKGSVGPSDFGTLTLAFDAKALPTVFLEPFLGSLVVALLACVYLGLCVSCLGPTLAG